ncbi:hypothetical protein TEA_025968 [Camellia sinensis var. sinensis]|uniref:Uncharacterized protein n=1 Tax=Camellia sinensis var. sinensis TaxID=542762 RepID=A0A4S4EKU4_CAMSN|nr:hypothetical protein TEA_025968 [Camellia sinensis var. sinensis]
MVMLCFVLDLRSLSPPLLGDLKQSLLQLANFYAVSAQIGERPRSDHLSDRIGLCYVRKNRISCSNEVKVVYTPRGNFSLRNFHHAVNNLPTDAFLPEFNGSGALSCCDMKLTSILSNEFLYSCGGHEKDIARKVILISSCVVENLDSVMKDTLMDAADNYVSVEFLLLEQQSSHLGDLSEKISNFVKQISDLENCSFHAYLPDAQVLCGLVKRWLQELKDDMDEPLQAHFVFKSNFFCSLNLISCNLSASSNHIIDEFSSCQTCRCHGIPLDNAFGQQTKRSSCPITGNDLETFSLIENSVKVGEHTILFLPSFQNCVKLQHVSLPVDLNVIERTNLGSLSEGVILGTSFIVTPSAFHESDDIDKSELNTQLNVLVSLVRKCLRVAVYFTSAMDFGLAVFQGLCSALHSLDQGLVCSSKCNIETMKESLFHCYYILLPSEKGPMLLRRLAGSEENLPFPDVSQLVGSSATIEIENSIRTSLLKEKLSGKQTIFAPAFGAIGFPAAAFTEEGVEGIITTTDGLVAETTHHTLMTQPNPPLQLQQREPSHRLAVDGEEDAGTASEEAVGGGGVTGGLLVVEGDESDAESDGAVGEGGDGDADKAERARERERVKEKEAKEKEKEKEATGAYLRRRLDRRSKTTGWTETETETTGSEVFDGLRRAATERERFDRLEKASTERNKLFAVCPNLKEVNYEPNSTQRDSSEEAKPSKPKADVVVIEEEIPQLDLTMGENRSSTCITEEWEQLIISEAPNIYSPTCISKPKLDQLVLSSQDGSRQQLDEKTSRILERLEVPRELKRKTPPAKSSITATAFAPTKAPLIPFQPVHGTDQGTTSSQPMKPNFPRLKRKQR